MRYVALVVVVLALTGPAAAAPADHAKWGEHLKARYQHAKSVEVASKAESLHLGLCSKASKSLRIQPGFTRLDLEFADPNLFQDAWIEIARVEAGVDVVGIVAKTKGCSANKRYQVAVQAGETLFLYHARCSQMRTPFHYDVADLVAAIEAAGAKVGERLIVNACGSFEHTVTTVAATKKNAAKQRKLYKHRFPASREAAKRKTP